jgi:selenocysteine lyase/cysteine desulfurase
MKNRIEAEFPILSTTTYLNTAASGLLSKSVLEFRKQHDEQFFKLGSKFKEHQGEMLSQTREAVGKFFTCKPNQVALVQNFSLGFNILLEGLPKESTFLLLKGDYPSINWPVETRGFNRSYVTISENLEQDLITEFERQQPDVFAFSIVHYISGIKIDLNCINFLKKRFPKTLFVADGTQYCGTEHFNFKLSGIDVLGASAYKWLNAGYGNGFFLFKDEVPNKVFPKTVGFNSSFGKYKQQDNSFLGRFEPGHQDTLNFGSLKVALNVMDQIGVENIEREIKLISTSPKQRFELYDLLDETVVKRKEHSSIFNIKGDDKLYNTLIKNEILCSQRGNGIRVSFNYFNTEAGLDKLMSVIQTTL